MRVRKNGQPLDGLLSPVSRTARERFLWAVVVRWLVIGGFLLLAIVAHQVGLLPTVLPCIAAAVIAGLLNGANHLCLLRNRHVGLVTAVAIPLDHVLTTYVVVNTGGVQSPFVMMYFVQVLATAMLVATRAATLSAMFAMLTWLVGVHWWSPADLQPLPPLVRGAGLSAAAPVFHPYMWAAFLLYCLALLVYLGGYILTRLRTSEQDLEDKHRRLEAALASSSAAHAELREAYRRLQQAEAQLVHSEKMRSLGQLVAGVAHELSNPISFISANVEHLRRYVSALTEGLRADAGIALPPAERARLDTVHRTLGIDRALADLPGLLDDCEEGARRTAHIVQELRTFARSDPHERWALADVHRCIDSTLALLAHRLKGHITLHREYGNLPDIECLPGPLNQVFMNLLANAVDAIGSKPGTIWISTHPVPAVGDSSTPPAVAIAIRDDGVGIPAEVQTNIFDPFFTTKEVGQGMGLGLSVVYGIVHRHGGSLAVNSTVGVGTSFTLTLPVRQVPAPAPPARA